MRKFLKSISFLVVLMLVLSSTLTAHAVTTLGVTYKKQEKTQWCWAATAQMTGKYMYPSSTRTQTQIVTNVKGSAVNDPATTSETATATKYATHNTINFAAVYSTFSFASVKSYIDAGIPLQPLVNDGSSGHYYVIYGYHESSSDNYLYLVDPWDGYGKYTSYSSFLNGTWTESRPWIQTVG